MCDSNSIKYTCNKQGKRKFILELAGRSARSARRINLCPLDHLSCGGQLGGFSSSFLQNLKKKTIISDVCFRDVSLFQRFCKHRGNRGESSEILQGGKGERRGFIWLPLYVFVCLRSNKETSRDINSKFSISPTVACYRGYIYVYVYVKKRFYEFSKTFLTCQ